MAEPQDQEGKDRIWQGLSTLNSLSVLGPVVKLMRWFSWFESEKFFRGENFCNKLLMMENQTLDPTKGVDFINIEAIQAVENQSKISAKSELQKLKIAHGTWALAPLLTTPSSIWQKDLIALIAAQCWVHHSQRAKLILTPQQVCSWTIHQVQAGWKQELLDLVKDAFYKVETFKKLYPENDLVSKETRDIRTEIHRDFICKLLGKRAASLVSFFRAPPLRYSPILLPEFRLLAQLQASSDFHTLLSLEAHHLRGNPVEGLDALKFLDSSYCRLFFLLNEQSLLDKDGGEQPLMMMKHAVEHLGDTACIESTHSSAKDSLRDSRSNFRSRVSKFYHCISARVLASRCTDHITVSEAQIATASVRKFPSVAGATNPNSHVLNREFQNLMKQKKGDHFWHGTTAYSLFEQVVALDWLLEGGMDGQNKSPLLSCMWCSRLSHCLE